MKTAFERLRNLGPWLRTNYWKAMIVTGLTLGALAAAFYLVEIAIAVTAMVDRLRDLASRDFLDTGSIRNLATGIAVLLGALAAAATLIFQLVRVWITERTTTATEEGLITDRINKAVEGLGAEKTVRKIFETPRYKKKNGEWVRDRDGNPVPALRPDSQPMVDREGFEFTEPNLEVRIGAIYALERIAQDSERDHIQIMEILCAYIRENSNATPPKMSMRERYERETENTAEAPGLTNEQFLESYGMADRDLEEVIGISAVKSWASRLPKPRTDIQVALEVIGRRWKARRDHEAAEEYRLDLRGANLQGCDMVNRHFEKADLRGARLEGAILSEAKLEEAKLWRARLEGSTLWRARLERASLPNARLEGADLRESRLDGVDLGDARLDGALVVGTHLNRVNLARANLERVSLDHARLEGANLWYARLAGAELDGAQLEGARIIGVRLGEKTSFAPGTLHGAGIKEANFSDCTVNQLFFQAFGDGSVKLPAHFKAGTPPLEHWPIEDLDLAEFERRWRAWQRRIGYTPPE
ncbi:MAG: pentapeptide repeat-containing protein [Pseudomonadota bacterium]